MIRKPNRLRVGVIGLGTIGSRAAANLRAAGHQVYVWNRTPRAEPNFLGSPVEVTDLCDTLQIFVPDDAALLATVRAVAPALKPRHLVLAHPTVSPEAAREAADIVGKTGARYVDAPFTGSRAAAGNGQLVYYVSGPEPARRDALPVLEATSKNVVVIGDAVGQATVTKIATNLVTAAIVQSLAEALALARAAGIDPARFAEAMEHNGSRSGTSDLKLPAMIKGDHATPHFALKHMLKDTRLALRLAAEHSLSLPATATVAAQLYGADRRGLGDLDFAALAKTYDPAPPAPAVPPTVIPETLPTALPPPAAAAAQLPPPSPAEPPAPAPASVPSSPTLGLPPVPGKTLSTPAEIESFLRDMTIPRGGLPFPPGDEPETPGGENPVSPGASVAAKEVSPPDKINPPSNAPVADPAEKPAIKSSEETPAPPDKPAPPGKTALPPDEKTPTATSLRHGPRGKHEPVALPAPSAPEPEPTVVGDDQPPRPPATRRTLLSWFQKGK